MADNEKNNPYFEREEFDVVDERDADNARLTADTVVKDDVDIDDLKCEYPEDDYADFEEFDVSEPRAPIKEMDAIEEALAIRRRDWIKTHLSYIYAAVGVVIVGLIVFGIYMYSSSTNPMSRFIGALSKDFSTSFHYEIEVTEDDKPMMSHTGDIAVDRSKHSVKSLYESDYNSYTYTGAVYAYDKSAAKGSYYNNKWNIRECTDSVQDFFDFDKAFRSGGFDAGAFLRFTGLTSDYSARELNSAVGVLRKRLSTNSSIATIKTEKAEDGTRYLYDINIYELFSMIKNEGASIFYRATDYDKFVALFEANKTILENTKCTASFVVDPAGYMSSFEMTVTSEGSAYGLKCKMSDFANAEVAIPDTFFTAAQLTPAE